MRRVLIPTVFLIWALALTGCTGTGGAMSESDAPGGGVAEPSMPLVPGSVDDAEGQVPGDRQQIVTGFVTLTVEHPLDAAGEAARIVEQAGGRVDARSETAPVEGDEGSAQLTVRIPTDKLTATLESIEELGELEKFEQDEQDVTSQARDLDARITALQTSVSRLTTLMAAAQTTADLISIEAALSERQANLEALQSQKRFLDDQVEMSTFTLYLGSEADAPVDEPDTFLSGLQAGWDAFVGFFGFLLVALGVLLPWLILASIIAVVFLLVVRGRKKAKSADHPSAPLM